MLPKNQPVEVAAMLDENDLRFEYLYPILPEGLVPRFIARTHVHSIESPRWRNGAVLRWEGSHAVVQVDSSRKCVSIRVGGESTSRRRLLAVVRYAFEALHQEYRFPIQAVIPLIADSRHVTVDYDKLVAAERLGKSTIDEFVGDTFVAVAVAKHLDGVELSRAGRSGLDVDERRTIRVFVSYSHVDEVHMRALESHLVVLKRSGLIDAWHDRRIAPGEEWAKRISDHLERADIVLCLLSPDFLASEYCNDVEIARALERRAEGLCQVMPIFVRDCIWWYTPLAELQPIPVGWRAITAEPDRDSAWAHVGSKIAEVAESLRKSKGPAEGLP